MWLTIGTSFRRPIAAEENIVTSRMKLWCGHGSCWRVGSGLRIERQGSIRTIPTRGPGTWHVTVTPYNCLSKLPLGFSFHALLAFARGGTLSGTSSNAAFQPGQYSASFGVWRATGGRNYTALTDAFILFPGGPFPAGRQEISHSIRVSADGNTFTDQASLNYFDVNDFPAPPQPPLIPGCATAAGLRVQ